MMRFDEIDTNEPAIPDTRSSLASWYTAGFSDALGDRLVMADNTTSTPLELLRFKREFGEAPEFENALRARVDELAAFDHPSFGKVRTVQRLGAGEGLALVSNQIAGRRLSDVLPLASGPSLAEKLIRRVTPALAALQNHASGVAHGLLTPDRIIVAPGGALVLAEHTLGSAVASLGLPAERLRSEFGLAVRDGVESLDARSDVVQLGHIALSLLVGWSVGLIVDRDRVVNLIDGYDRVASTGFGTPRHLRIWLERALQVGSPAFSSAKEAEIALADWTDQPALPFEPTRQLVGSFWQPATEGAALETEPPAGESDFSTLVPDFSTSRLPVGSSPNFAPKVAQADLALESNPRRQNLRRRITVGSAPLAIASLAALSILEAVMIAVMMFVRPAPSTLPLPSTARAPVTVRPAAPPPPQPPQPTQSQENTAAPKAAPSSSSPPRPVVKSVAPLEAAVSAVPDEQSGQLIITSDPAGGAVMVDGVARGTTPLSITIASGDHEVQITTSRYISRETVRIQAGKTMLTSAALPASSASTSAQPQP